MARKAFKLPGKTAAKPKRRPGAFKLVKQEFFWNESVVSIDLPIKLVTESNTGGHWRPKAKRAASQRGLLKLFAQKIGNLRLPVRVTLTRIAPRALDAGDNLPSSMKHVRDGVADALKVDDRDPRIEWIYQQTSYAPKTYGCNVFVETKS